MKQLSLSCGFGGYLIAVLSLWLSSPWLGISQETEPDREAAGLEWKLVRQGGGFVSPAGTTGEPLIDVAWGAGRFVAVGHDGTILHSRDGDRWQEASRTATAESLRGVAWGKGRFVAVGDEGTIVHSTDGDRWERASDSATSERLDHVTWGNGRFVAVGEGNGTIVHSNDGDRWEEAADSATWLQLSSVVWTGARFVAVMPYWTNSVAVYSADGDRWEEAPEAHSLHAFNGVAWSGTGFGLGDVAWNGERFVAVSEWGSTIVHSSRRSMPLPGTAIAT